MQLERRIVVAFIYLSITVSASRKEDLERAAELAVERSAERAAERAVEKSLEAGNKTSMTITVKESYSNARKIAEEQAAPGSESTRQNNNEKTSIFESKDFPDTPDYETPLNEQEYIDYNDTRSENDYEDLRAYDYNEPKVYNDYNDSRAVDDYENDYDDSNVTKITTSSQSPTKLNDQDAKIIYDYNLDDPEEDYPIPNPTDYQKLNTSSTTPEIIENFGDFDSDFRNEFGTKITNGGGKLSDASLEDFYQTGGNFVKKQESKKVDKKEEDELDEEVPEYRDEDTWKSYSDWHKDFKSISEESFPNGSFWDDDDDSLKLWSDDEEAVEKKSTNEKNVTPKISATPKTFDFKTWQPHIGVENDNNDDDDDELGDNIPAADAVDSEIDSDVPKKNANSYRRRSSRDDYFYQDGPVYTETGGDEMEETTTERITTTTTEKSSAARFRNTFRERSRAQYEKIMQGRYADSVRRSPYNNRIQNLTEEDDRNRAYRTGYTGGGKNSGIYNPLKELTTYRVYPKALDDKVCTILPICNIFLKSYTKLVTLIHTQHVQLLIRLIMLQIILQILL